MIAALVSYLIIAIIIALLVMFGYYTFNYHESVKKSEIVIEWIKSIIYGLLWPVWLVKAILDEIFDYESYFNN